MKQWINKLSDEKVPGFFRWNVGNSSYIQLEEDYRFEKD